MRTIVVMLLVASVLMALTLAVGIKAGRRAGFATWNVGLGLYALGWLLIAARGALPDVIGVALGDALLLAGLCAQLAAIIEFGGGTAPRLLLIVPGPVLFVLTVPLLGDYASVTLLVSLAYAIAFGAIAIATARLGPAAGPARWMLAAGYSAAAALVPLRAVDIWQNPVAHPDIFAASNLHIVTFMVLFSITVVGSVAFILMHRERAEAELFRLASFDPLTGLFNRRAFIELAERELARARRARSPYAVLMVDLDHFKRVNDEYGHQAGDRVLAGFGDIAKRSLRTEDLVGRYGGEEFCALLPGAAMPMAVEIAERLRQAVSERPLAGLPRAVTVSIGATACNADTGGSLDAAIARADEALYRAKREGRNRVCASE